MSEGDDIITGGPRKSLQTFLRELESGIDIRTVSTLNTRIYVGVSGFSYPGWKGGFYPMDLKSEDFLSYYSSKLNSVEINSSFYAPPSMAMVKSWSSKTPDDFRFSIKAPRQVTHILKLGQAASHATARLAKTIRLLEGKLGPVLFQLPPFSKRDLKLLESFLTTTADLRQKVFEFRHESWLDDSTYQMLDKYNAGFCIAETEDMKPVVTVTGGLSYFRLRKDSYDQEAIDDWAKKISETIKSSSSGYVYLRHDETGQNASLASRLVEKI